MMPASAGSPRTTTASPRTAIVASNRLSRTLRLASLKPRNASRSIPVSLIFFSTISMRSRYASACAVKPCTVTDEAHPDVQDGPRTIRGPKAGCAALTDRFLRPADRRIDCDEQQCDDRQPCADDTVAPRGAPRRSLLRAAESSEPVPER